MVPPVGIVPRGLHYMKCQHAAGTLVVPLWPSAHFWPLIMDKYNNYFVAHVFMSGRRSLLGEETLIRS